MVNEIKYNALSANPSDYEAPDGDLALALNMINENGALSTLQQPGSLFSIPQGYKLLCLHKTNSFTHYIFCRFDKTEGAQLFWSDDSNPEILKSIEFRFPQSKYFTLPHLLVNPIGNILYVSFIDDFKLTIDALSIYLVWNSPKYNIYHKPPFTALEFSLYEITNSATYKSVIGLADDDAKAAAVEWCRNNGASAGQRSTESFDNDVSNAVWGHLLSHINDKITSQNFFYQPFFIRYAFRYYDGTHSLHSAPVLMIPQSAAPLVESKVEFSDNAINMSVIPHIRFGQLQYRVLSPDIQNLSLWKDFITHVDIFVSAPIYTFEQSKDITRTVNGASQTLKSSISFFDGNESQNVPDQDTYYWKLPQREIDIIKTDICDSALFYLIASIPLEHIIDPPDEPIDGTRPGISSDVDPLQFRTLPLENDCLNALVNRPVLSDDYNSHCSVISSYANTYNNRLNLANVIRRLYDGFPIRSMVQARFISNDDDFAKYQLPRIQVHLKKNGVDYSVFCYPGDEDSHINNPEASPFVIDAPNELFPRFLFYPDPDAYKMDIVFIRRRSESQTRRIYSIPLIRHNTLNGAYYFRGFSDDMPPYTDFGLEDMPVIPAVYGHEFIYETNKIYTSEVNNPFFFPLSMINSVGTGEIFGISTAAKALSEGQFGQFPLYAFSDQGIWALELSSTGSYIAKQPISRDVCISNKSITPIDSAVLFAADRGIMIISGSNVQCISDQISNKQSFNIDVLPMADVLIKLFNETSHTTITKDDITILPFGEFIKECQIIYDYKNQRIIVFNNAIKYAYVYSLKSKSWGMMLSDIVDNINSYPNAIALNNNCEIVDFSVPDNKFLPGLIVTRPLKLSAPDILKTIDSVIQRGMFDKNSVAQILYGSNDLINWCLVWGSSDKYLRGFSGSPFKFFRLALISNLNDGESLYGCSVNLSLRFNNRLR